MALFNNLHDVAQVLTEHIKEEVGIVDVQPGIPRDVTATTEAAVRITLLYTTPQPTHRNDLVEPQPNGNRRFPPLTLSCYYLVTASGADTDDPVGAHHALGRVMTLYRDTPVLRLPLTDDPGSPPGAFSALGEGELAVTQVPMSLEQIDKIWMALDVGVQPWALFEVAPVQLVSQLPDETPAPVVRPGGIGLEVRAGTRPLITRVTPELVRRGGRVRIDTLAQGTLEAVDVADVEVPAGDASLEVAPTGSPLVLTLDDGGLETLGTGAQPLLVRASGLVSRRGVLRIAEAGKPVIDAPPSAAHDAGTDLVLTGANLAGAGDAVLWPDVGLTAPTDVHTLPVADVTADAVTIPSAGGLATVPSGRGPWRLAVRTGTQYTPYVVLELTS